MIYQNYLEWLKEQKESYLVPVNGDDPMCGCGEPLSKHTKETLSHHHYWYIHKEQMSECFYCRQNKEG